MLFIVKFYQCLLTFQLPPKTKKLTLIGDKNSGKTTLVNVIRGLTHPEFIATVSKEKVFGMSMVHDDTQFVFLDEFSHEVMTASQAKIFLQGGLVTIPRKHEDPEVVDNQAGTYHVMFSLKITFSWVNYAFIFKVHYSSQISMSVQNYFSFHFLFVSRYFRYLQQPSEIWRR